jgi:hypothetical protein
VEGPVEGLEIAPFTQIPFVSPSCEGIQTFVYHPQVANSLRKQKAYFMCGQKVVFFKFAKLKKLIEIFRIFKNSEKMDIKSYVKKWRKLQLPN